MYQVDTVIDETVHCFEEGTTKGCSGQNRTIVKW